jgi:hypothetical protein
MLDISRDRVPTLQTLRRLVDDLSSWKVNHLQLYMEHTFAYRQHGTVWAQASPLTATDIQALDSYCRDRHIELAPCQNAFGHFDRWLRHPAYRHLAACPDGYIGHQGERRDVGWSLDPANPAVHGFLAGLFAELLPNFSSRRVNVGCDETWDLGQGRTEALCRTRGRDRVFLDHLQRLNEITRSHDCTMHYFADMVVNSFPHLLHALPRDAVALDWGYVAAYPFREHGLRFREAGVPFWVVTGTSTWSTLAGCSETAWSNNRNGVMQGVETGAGGVLNTEWGDGGHWQHHAIALLPFAMGAVHAWHPDAHDEVPAFLRAADIHVFRDEAGVMARVAWDLGCVWEHVGRDMTQANILQSAIRDGRQWRADSRVTRAHLMHTRQFVQDTVARLAAARSQRPDAALLIAEFTNAADFLLHGCDLALSIIDPTARHPTALHESLESAIARFESIWNQRNHIGGLSDSTRILKDRLRDYQRSTA